MTLYGAVAGLTDRPGTEVIRIWAVAQSDVDAWKAARPAAEQRWLEGVGFKGKAGGTAMIPGEDGDVAGVVAVIGAETPVWDWAAVAQALPAGVFRIDGPAAGGADAAALGWALAAYRFDAYKDADPLGATLVWPEECDGNAVANAANATHLVRDLINTPAEDMGPEQLADAAATLAKAYGGSCAVTVGEALLSKGYPAIHAVGRASVRPPRLIDLRWGDRDAPQVTLVGKGVCFDSGGLDLKPASAMKLMKKDMGGAATVLGLARMAMAADLKIHLRVLIPAVENSVAGNALRPLDVVKTRAGTCIEIGNTDAEGRVILADALTEACSERPTLLIDCATLTGAARVALGPELPALFCNDDSLAGEILHHAQAASDPVWRLPLWPGYRRLLESPVADMTNAPDGPFAGAITAALFLQAFVADGVSWAHLDLMGWNIKSRPGRPEGGEAMAMRALFALLATRFPR